MVGTTVDRLRDLAIAKAPKHLRQRGLMCRVLLVKAGKMTPGLSRVNDFLE